MGKTYEEIKRGANCFAASAIILDKIGMGALKQDSIMQGVLVQNIIPSIVLKAFSCELALKALIVKSNKDIKNIHKLNALYKKLDVTHKDAIEQMVVNRIKEKEEDYRKEQFLLGLDNISTVFQDWRYFYEHESIVLDILFFNSFYDSLIKYLREQ